jgi:hypothetical protein
MRLKNGALMALGGIHFAKPRCCSPWLAWLPGKYRGFRGLILTRGEFFLFYMIFIFIKKDISRRPRVYFLNAPKKAIKPLKAPINRRLPPDSAIYSITHTYLTKEQDHAK